MNRFNNCESSSRSSSESDITEQPSCTCCQCINKKKRLTRGRFGLAYIVETPTKKMTTPVGWQMEFEDTPSGIIKDCNEMVDWVSYPPLRKCNNTHFVEYPPSCPKMLKSTNNLIAASTQCQCTCRENGTNTIFNNTNKTTCNCGCNTNRVKPPKRCQDNTKLCSYCQNSKPVPPTQCLCCTTDCPVHYQGCYWYRNKDTQHCWYTNQDIGVRNQNNNNHEQNLDYVPSKENNKDGTQIFGVKDGQTQYQEETSSPRLSFEQEPPLIKKLSSKQVGTTKNTGQASTETPSPTLSFEQEPPLIKKLSSKQVGTTGQASAAATSEGQNEKVPINEASLAGLSPMQKIRVAREKMKNELSKV